MGFMQSGKMITQNFSRAEIACRCGCGADQISLELICKLQESRDEYFKIFNEGLIVACGCRCPKHNTEVGGEDKSAHITTEKKIGEAVDIACTDSHKRHVLIGILRKYFTRMEVGSSWLHVDVARDDNHPQEVTFLPKYAQRK
jgi:zinc D-Ala-D-Ala carboxypeptidase